MFCKNVTSSSQDLNVANNNAANEFVSQWSFYDLLKLWIIKEKYYDEDHPIYAQNISL